jgi:hypothetical protein
LQYKTKIRVEMDRFQYWRLKFVVCIICLLLNIMFCSSL